MTLTHAPAATPVRSPYRRIVAAAAAILCAGTLVLGSAMPANAVAMKAVLGNIKCTAYPNISIGTSATARGTVQFQLNAYNNTQSLYYVSLGTSSTYASWSWKFWASQAGNFYAYAWGNSGSVTSVARWCHNING
jgi:hypothetical protein